jgi:hypothetical protein
LLGWIYLWGALKAIWVTDWASTQSGLAWVVGCSAGKVNNEEIRRLFKNISLAG